MKIKPQQHKCKVPKCPYRHDQPQQQESKSRRFGKSTLVTNAFLVAAKTGQKAIFENPDYVCLTRESYKAFISTERQRVLGEVRELVEGMKEYNQLHIKGYIQWIHKKDLLSALKELEGKEE